MNYLLKIVVPSVPPYNHDAYGFADQLLRDSKGMPPAPRLIQFHDALTARFPCPSTGIYDNAETGAVCPWGHVPLMEGLTGDVGVITITARNVEVIPFLLRRAGALALTVIDEQAGKVHRPATFSITLDGFQQHVDHEAIVAKLVPLFKRTPEEVREVLAIPKAVLKRRLDHVTAQRFVRTLDLVGCNCTIEKEMPELGLTIPISGPGVGAVQFPSAQNDSFDSRSPSDKGVSWQPCWVARVWDKVANRRQY
jgi:hypothetical protein